MIVEYSEEARRDLKRLSKDVARRIVERVRWLGEHFDAQAPQALGGEFRGMYKLRVGDWRVVYAIQYDQHRIVVHVVDHRSRIYRQR